MISVGGSGFSLDPAGAGPQFEQALARAGTAVAGYARLDLIQKRIGDTGKLGQQIDSTVRREGSRYVSRVVSRAPYSIFVHEGTASPIRPRIARSLRFRGSGGTFVFAAQVRGTRETGRFTPFLRNGLERLRLNDFT